MPTVDQKIEQLSQECIDIENVINGHKAKLYDNRKKLKALLETKLLLEE